MAANAPSAPQKPQRFWGLTLALLFGVFAGLSIFTFDYGEGLSYFSNDPAACQNCHIMRAQFDAWNHSSHKHVAACNDCHTPHSFAAKYIVKGINGWNHSLAFTTGNFPDPIRIRAFNARIAQDNCVDCHAGLVSQIHGAGKDEETDCVSCHGNVGHGR